MFTSPSAWTLLQFRSVGESDFVEDGALTSDWLPGLALVVVIVIAWGAWHRWIRGKPASH